MIWERGVRPLLARLNIGCVTGWRRRRDVSDDRADGEEAARLAASLGISVPTERSAAVVPNGSRDPVRPAERPAATPARGASRMSSGGRDKAPASLVLRAVSRIAHVPRTLRPWVLALAVGTVIASLAELNVFQPAEVLAAYAKTWIRAKAPLPALAERIVVVAVDDASLGRFGPWGPRWRAHHGELLKVLADDGARAVGFDITFKTPNDEFDPRFVDGIRYGRARGVGVVLGVEYDAASGRMVPPAAALRTAATTAASTYLFKDRVTNLVRYVMPFQDDRDPALRGAHRLAPSLSAAVAMAGGTGFAEITSRGHGPVPIDFAGSPGAFQTISYADAYERRFPPGTFRDRYVMVGVVFPASRDFFDTPAQPQMAGVFVHTSALYTVLRGAAPRLPPVGAAAVIVAAATLTALISCLRVRRRTRPALVVGVVAGYWLLVLTLASRARPCDLDFVPVTVTIGLVWATLQVADKGKLREQFRFIRHTFGRYMSKEVVDTLLGSPDGLRLGGELREITLLVSDLRGFSSLANRLPPEEVIRILNGYLERVVEILMRYRATIDEFQGDGILAFFGAPLAAPDDAERAVACAIEMQHALTALNEEQRAAGLPELEMGIGINTGEVIVGNIGSETRTKYGAVGAPINLAYRIESQTVGGQVLIGPRTYELVRDVVDVRGTLEVALKGVDTLLTIYDVAAIRGAHATALVARAETTRVALAPPRAVRCYRLDGKRLADTALSGTLCAVSETTAELVLEGALEPRETIRLVVEGMHAYAKVVDAGTNGSVVVVFTDVSPDLKRWLAEELACASS